MELEHTLWGFPQSPVGKESACNAGDPGSIPGSGRSPGEGKGYPLQYCGLENSMDCIVHGAAKSRTRLSDFQFHPPPGWKPPSFPLLELVICQCSLCVSFHLLCSLTKHSAVSAALCPSLTVYAGSDWPCCLSGTVPTHPQVQVP